MFKLVTTAFVIAITATSAASYDLTEVERYPGLKGHMDGGWFRPIGVAGPEIPVLDDIFTFIQDHSPVHRGLHPQAGEDVFVKGDIPPPVIRFLNDEQMAIFAGGGMGTALAIYEEGYMYLSPNIDFSNDEDLSILVHELVHHVQWFSGLNELEHFQACPIHLEFDAYRIQLAWMDDADVSDDWVYQMRLNQQIQGSTICYADRP